MYFVKINHADIDQHAAWFQYCKQEFPLVNLWIMTERSNRRVENGKNEKEWIVFGKICYLSFTGNLPVLLVALIGSKRFSKVE